MCQIKTITVSCLASFLLLLMMSCAHTCSQQREGPFLLLEESSFDFGQIESGAVVAHVFKFQNCGTDTLRIKRVRGT